MAIAKSGRKRETTGGAEAGPSMWAVVHDGYGSADVLRLARIPRPSPGKGDVLVRVHAAALDRGTWHLMTGTPWLVRLATGLRGPRQPVPGRDVAGTIVEVGPEVTRFVVGEEVFGIGSGSFAEYVVARETRLATKPSGTTFEQAAAAPISGITALQALTKAGRLREGQRVLVIGASGGVGSYAVQLAKVLGAGCDGCAASSPPPVLAQRLTMLVGTESGADLQRLAARLASGELTPSIGRTYLLALATDAMRHLEAGLVRGKVVLTV